MLLGAPLWLLGAVIPIVGWAAGVVTLIASIGVTACVVLAPHTFDEPGGKAPPSAEALASAIGPPVLPDIPFEDDDIPSPSDP